MLALGFFICLSTQARDEVFFGPGGSITKLKLIDDTSILSLRVDAIVNPANVFLANGGGLAYAIAQQAGPALQQAIDALPKKANGQYLNVGQALSTPAFNLTRPATWHAGGIVYIIHTVGPDVRDPQQAAHKEALLKSAYTEALNVASKHPEIKSIAFPSISTGIFCYPIEEAMPIAINAVAQWIQEHPNRFEVVVFSIDRSKQTDSDLYYNYLLNNFGLWW